MKVEWADNAKRQKNQVAYYIRRRFGINREKRFKQEVNQTIIMIMQHPNIGPIDPLFNDRPIAYRSVIINGLSKMVYSIGDDTIYIVAFWDTRREPVQQAQETK